MAPEEGMRAMRKTNKIHDEPDQRHLTEFMGGKMKPLSLEDAARRDRRILIKRHREEFIRLSVEYYPHNSLELELLLAQVLKTIRDLEKKDVCYLKTMKNGKLRVFKRYRCCLTLEDWKKCQEPYCPAGGRPENCPNYSEPEPSFTNVNVIRVTYRDEKSTDKTSDMKEP